jgi:chromosome transmission fidelity protein 4
MVGLNSTQVFCVVCKLPDTYPQVAPKPVLSVLNLSLPLACSDLGADDLENEYLRGSLVLSQMQKKAEDAAACGRESNMEEDCIFKMEAALDRCLLRLIANCCKGDKLVRATELARLLSLEKSLQGAIKLVSAMKLPMLAERFNNILEEKILQENMETISCRRVTSEARYIDTPISVDAKQVSYKANLGDNPAPPNRQVEPKHSSPVFSKPDTRIEEDNSEAITKGYDTKIQNGNLNSVDAEVQPTIHNDSIQKPSNPFAKASNTSANQAVQRNASLLSSIKQMKTATENEGKRKERARSGSLPQKPAKHSKIS